MKNQNISLFCLLTILIFTFVVNNSILEPNIMESRNFTAAREMLEKGNWLHPTMNGEQRLEKPPLPTWITALTMAIFGQDNLTLLRLPAILSGMLLVFFLFMLVRELSDDKDLPFLTAGTAATSFYILFMARDNSWDIYCHSLMLGAIWLIHKSFKKPDWITFIGAGILMGLSFLSKGPVSFYSLLLPYLIVRGITHRWKVPGPVRIKLFTMITITLILSLWWPVFTFLTNQDSAVYVAQKESAAWINRNVRPFYHYWSFPVQSGIWIIMASVALVWPYAKKRIEPIINYWPIAAWVWISVLLLSLFPEKKERYLMPTLIPLAILAAAYFRYLIIAFRKEIQTKTDILLLRLNSIVMSLVSVAIPAGLFYLSRIREDREYFYLAGLSTVFIIFSLTFVRAAILKKPLLLWGGMVGLMMASCLLLFPVYPKIVRTNPGYRSYTELRTRSELKGLPFYFNGVVPGKFIEVVWSCGREIKAWDPLENKNLPVTPPLVFLSNQQPIIILPSEILDKYEVEIIGHFDSNFKKEGEIAIFSNFVSIIKPKNPAGLSGL